MIAGSFQCMLVTWEEAEALAKKLAFSIMESGYSPDIVIAIGRGGFVPARVVCDFMMHERLTSIRIEHWGVAARMKGKATVTFPLSVGILGQEVLIIDDVTDTGDTLRAAVDYIRSLHPAGIRTGVLHHKTSSPVVPDFFARAETEWKWIIYPWALHEDLAGFTERLLSNEFETLSGIKNRLFERFAIDATEDQIEGAAESLARAGKAERSGSLLRRKIGNSR